MLSRGFYRSRQFFAAWRSISKQDMAEARRVLGLELYSIFSSMPRQYRLHSLNVYRHVRQAGCDDPTVLQAALLHDSGKFDSTSGRYVTIAHRVIVVLLSATAPGRLLLKRLSGPPSRNAPVRRLTYWRYPFYLSAHHAELGSEIAARHGAQPELVELIRKHHTYHDQSPGLKVLQAADDRS